MKNPQPTIHPSIVQLNTWDAGFDAQHYFTALNQFQESKTAAFRRARRIVRAGGLADTTS